MKFLHITGVFPPAFGYGGVPLAAFGLAHGLMELGYDNLVLTTDANGSKRLPVISGQLTQYQDVPVIYTHRWGCNPYFYSPSLAERLRESVREFDLALVRGNWGYINLLARMHLPGLNVPYILYPEGTFDAWAMLQKRWKKLPYWHLIEKYNYHQAAGAVALTEAEYHQTKEYVPQISVEVIPNGINLADFYPAPDYGELAQRFPDLADRPFILFLSRLHYKKGLDVLFEALAEFLNSGQKSDQLPRLVVAGAGDQTFENNLRSQVAQLGLADQVKFTGMVTGLDKLCLLHHCSFLMLPSRSEGLPVAVLEALACAKPVIITPQCNLPEVAEAGAGLIVHLEPSVLAQGIYRMWKNSEERQVMGERAKKLIEDKFTWSSVAEKTVQFCQNILDDRKPRKAS
ncbi:MAG TPA: hypothetical protein DCY27_02940 [Desulfobacterales bacterium]|nr:hypothetical protein [Desulfobacterales bacterium]